MHVSFTTVAHELKLHGESTGLWSVESGLTVSPHVPGMERKDRWPKLRPKSWTPLSKRVIFSSAEVSMQCTLNQVPGACQALSVGQAGRSTIALPSWGQTDRQSLIELSYK